MAQTLKEQLAALVLRVEALEAEVAQLKVSRRKAPRHVDSDIVTVTCAKCKRKGKKTFAEAKGFRLCASCIAREECTHAHYSPSEDGEYSVCDYCGVRINLKSKRG